MELIGWERLLAYEARQIGVTTKTNTIDEDLGHAGTTISQLHHTPVGIHIGTHVNLTIDTAQLLQQLLGSTAIAAPVFGVNDDIAHGWMRFAIPKPVWPQTE